MRPATSNTTAPIVQSKNQPEFSHCDGDPVQMDVSSERGVRSASPGAVNGRGWRVSVENVAHRV